MLGFWDSPTEFAGRVGTGTEVPPPAPKLTFDCEVLGGLAKSYRDPLGVIAVAMLGESAEYGPEPPAAATSRLNDGFEGLCRDGFGV